MGKINANPEQSLVVLPILKYMNDHGFSCHQVESKAVFSKAIGRYKRGMTVRGFPDIAGCTPEGLGCFVECKAPGRLSTLRPEQRVFLVIKINRGCFGACVDSPVRFQEIYERWLRCPPAMGKAFLLACLPQGRRQSVDTV